MNPTALQAPAGDAGQEPPPVLDASVAVAWCFADERTQGSDRLLDRVAVQGALVPSLWYSEVAGLLLDAQRHGRASAEQVDALIDALEALPIQTDAAAADLMQREVLRLARTHGLSVFEAHYLDLATRRRAPLATRRFALSAAARAAGIQLLDL